MERGTKPELKFGGGDKGCTTGEDCRKEGITSSSDLEEETGFKNKGQA